MKLNVTKSWGIYGNENFTVADWTLHPGKIIAGFITSVLSNIAKIGWTVGILQLDGGGILGVLTCYILYALESMGINVRDRFKILFTCSTGSIIGSLICAGWSMKKILQWYIEKGPGAFKHNPFWGGFIWGALYSPKEIEALLLMAHGTKTLKQYFDETGIDWFIAVYDIDLEDTVILNWRTHPDWLVVEAVICSMSAPIYFPARHYMGRAYCDGGTGTQTCLAEAAYDYATFILHLQPGEFYLLSLGCGWAKTGGQGKNKIDIALWVLAVGRNETVKDQDEFIAARFAEGRLFCNRWNPRLDASLEVMDDCDNIDELIALMEAV